MAAFIPEPWTRKSRGFANGRSQGAAVVKRWNGAARTATPWDSLRKDPELWFRKGNCIIHLYGKGQSRRGPSFKVPFADLIEARCFPLIERFLVLQGVEQPGTAEELEAWCFEDPTRLFELYIPPPPGADKAQAFQYHLATRNLFAWAFRRSMVGEHLGDALVGLLNSMYEFRSDVEDNVQDMMDYLHEEGYLDVIDHPDHALAMLQLAGHFQFDDLYIRAFAHCVGMNDFLYMSPEYESATPQAKKLIRNGRIDMDSRLYKASDMLRNFFDDELSDAHLGIPPGPRAHLERFRSFLLSFYTSKLGYYPPQEFDHELYCLMRDDFEALYELLMDTTYSSSETLPSVAVGGICTLQLIQAFDVENGYEPLEHPLPLLPQHAGASRTKSVGRMLLLRGDRPTLGQRLTTHVALANASNWHEDAFRNDLVRAYRRFEEDSVAAPNRGDRQEKVSVLDARKVRWILVYAIYQALRSVTDVPVEVGDDLDAPYHLAVSVDDLPPWQHTQAMPALLRRQTDEAVAASSGEVCWGDAEVPSSAAGRIEIRPDVDYFALTHRTRPEAPRNNRSDSMPVVSAGGPAVPLRSSSLTQALSRSSTFRRSMMLFKPLSTAPSSSSLSSRPAYHEILVHGYGNGTNDVNFDDSSVPPLPSSELMATRSNSTGSNSDTLSTPETLDSADSSVDTGDSIKTPGPAVLLNSHPLEDLQPRPLRLRRRDVVSMMAPAISRSLSLPAGSRARPVSTIEPTHDYSAAYGALVEEERQKMFGGEEPARREPLAAGAVRATSLRHRGGALLSELKRRGATADTLPAPRIRGEDVAADEHDEWEAEQQQAQEWASMQAFMDGGEGAQPPWEQYADLGGLTEAR